MASFSKLYKSLTENKYLFYIKLQIFGFCGIYIALLITVHYHMYSIQEVQSYEGDKHFRQFCITFVSNHLSLIEFRRKK